MDGCVSHATPTQMTTSESSSHYSLVLVMVCFFHLGNVQPQTVLYLGGRGRTLRATLFRKEREYGNRRGTQAMPNLGKGKLHIMPLLQAFYVSERMLICIYSIYILYQNRRIWWILITQSTPWYRSKSVTTCWAIPLSILNRDEYGCCEMRPRYELSWTLVWQWADMDSSQDKEHFR